MVLIVLSLSKWMHFVKSLPLSGMPTSIGQIMHWDFYAIDDLNFYVHETTTPVKFFVVVLIMGRTYFIWVVSFSLLHRRTSSPLPMIHSSMQLGEKPLHTIGGQHKSSWEIRSHGLEEFIDWVLSENIMKKPSNGMLGEHHSTPWLKLLPNLKKCFLHWFVGTAFIFSQTIEKEAVYRNVSAQQALVQELQQDGWN